MENLILDMGAFSWQNATYTIRFILTIYVNTEKLMVPGRCVPDEFFSWKCGKLWKTAKSGYPALIWPFRTSVFSALSWNKISHMKLQSLTAVFCSFTHTQTRASLPREWLECEWSGINWSVGEVQHWYSLPSLTLLTGVILENVKMSPERYCFSELEKDFSLEMLALHKNVLEREKIDFRSIN